MCILTFFAHSNPEEYARAIEQCLVHEKAGGLYIESTVETDRTDRFGQLLALPSTQISLSWH